MTTKTQPKILDLGCGNTKYPGAIGIDRLKLPSVDFVHDLEKYPFPFKDNSFDKIVARNLLEHLGDTIAIFREVHRLLKPSGTFYFEVPHFSCVDMYKDPTHKSFFGYDTVGYFAPEDKLFKFNYAPDVRFKIIKRHIIFWGTKKVFDKPQEWLFNKIPFLYERKLAWIFPAWQLIVELECQK